MPCCGGASCGTDDGVKIGEDLWSAMKTDDEPNQSQSHSHSHKSHGHEETKNDDGAHDHSSCSHDHGKQTHSHDHGHGHQHAHGDDVEEVDISSGDRLKKKLKQKTGNAFGDDSGKLVDISDEINPDWEDEKDYWKEESKGTRAKYSFWLMLLVALPMLFGLIPVYEFASEKMEEYDVVRRVSISFGVAETYEDEVRGLYAKYAPWKLKNETEFNGHMWGLMGKWSGKERKLIKKLKRKYVMVSEKRSGKPKKKKNVKDDAFYQYQQKKQAKKDKAAKLARETRAGVNPGKGGGKKGGGQADRERARRKELDEEAAKHIPETVADGSGHQKDTNTQDGPTIDLDKDKNEEL